ncbi:MAG: hypothetical protein JO280_03990 [Mycobacteriaceae bacterium]|nr:hypothetical protein [Mycobacteriaceae bacterium]
MTMKAGPRWRRALGAGLAGTGLAVALACGSAAGTARADVIDDLANEFTTAAGGGEMSTLLNQSLKLRGMGFKPTAAELTAIQDSEKYRPNQTPMITALKNAVDGQTHRMQQANAAAKKGGFSIGINQYDPTSPGGITAGPGGINLGGGAWQIGGQPGTVVGPPG